MILPLWPRFVLFCITGINEAIQHLPASFDPSTHAPELQVCAGEKKTTPRASLHVHNVKAKTHPDESPGKAEEANKK